MGGDPVVTGEDDEAHVVQRLGRHPALAGGQPHAQLAEPAQGTGGRGERRHPGQGLGVHRSRRRRHRAAEVGGVGGLGRHGPRA